MKRVDKREISYGINSIDLDLSSLASGLFRGARMADVGL
jgi:hypothetical protein